MLRLVAGKSPGLMAANVEDTVGLFKSFHDVWSLPATITIALILLVKEVKPHTLPCRAHCQVIEPASYVSSVTGKTPRCCFSPGQVRNRAVYTVHARARAFEPLPRSRDEGAQSTPVPGRHLAGCSACPFGPTAAALLPFQITSEGISKGRVARMRVMEEVLRYIPQIKVRDVGENCCLPPPQSLEPPLFRALSRQWPWRTSL